MKNQWVLLSLALALLVFDLLSSPPPSAVDMLTEEVKNDHTATTTDTQSNQGIASNNHSNVRMSCREAKSALEQFWESRPRPDVNLDSNATFLHIGKAGGGTIFKEQFPAWRVKVRRCHPRPCQTFLRKEREKLENAQTMNSTELFLINARDPIDRFESAFYYMRSMYCHPDLNKESRMSREELRNQREEDGSLGQRTNVKILPKALTDQMIVSTCKHQAGNGRVWVYYIKYEENVNLLAEELCSNNETKRMEAQRDLRRFDHLYAAIDDWMKYLYSWPGVHNDNVFPIVVMPHVTTTNNNNNLIKNSNHVLEQQVDQAMEWLYKKLRFESPQDFSLRQMAVQCQKNSTTAPKVSFRHSSKVFKHPVLSEKSKACLAEFYRLDYKWLEHIGKKLCKTSGCKQGIDAIFKQRAPLLEPLWEKEKDDVE